MGFLIENPTDLYYFTGMSMSHGHLFVLKDRVRLFVDGRYLEAASAQKQIPVEELKVENEMRWMGRACKIGFRADVVTFANYSHFEKTFRKSKSSLVPNPSQIQKNNVICL